MDSLKSINTRNPRTPQRERANARQVQNNAGGYVYKVDDLAKLRRFLILGVEGGTFYVSQKDLAKDNATTVLDLARSEGVKVVDEILAISLEGRAVKQQPTMFALAAVAGLGNDDARRAAFAALPKVARTGTHLFLFAGYVEQFRGWGRGLRKAVGAWYTEKDVDKLAYQLVKYRQREGWSHRDLLRLSHPETDETARKALFDWTVGRPAEQLPAVIQGYLAAQEDGAPLPALIKEFGLSWEMLPSESLKDVAVWEALLDNGMPLTALIRNLGRLTSLGVLGRGTKHTKLVAAQLVNEEALRKSRVHPLTVLVALKTYASGHGDRGSLSWTPQRAIIDALDKAFYLSFGNVEATGKRFLLALDVSGSMGAQISGLPLSARDASAALALVTANVEDDYDIVGFTAGSNRSTWGWSRDAALTELAISPRQRLDDIIGTISRLPFGGTDCALPVTDALKKNENYDVFVVLTDNETWQGDVHVDQALRDYRRKVNPEARMVVVGMTSTGFSIADPADPLSLDVVGFDTATPQLISDFAAGRI